MYVDTAHTSHLSPLSLTSVTPDAKKTIRDLSLWTTNFKDSFSTLNQQHHTCHFTASHFQKASSVSRCPEAFPLMEASPAPPTFSRLPNGMPLTTPRFVFATDETRPAVTAAIVLAGTWTERGERAERAAGWAAGWAAGSSASWAGGWAVASMTAAASLVGGADV